MAIMTVLISGLAGLTAAVAAMIGFDAHWSRAFFIYIAASTLPVALVFAALYLQILFRSTVSPPRPAPGTQRIR